MKVTTKKTLKRKKKKKRRKTKKKTKKRNPKKNPKTKPKPKKNPKNSISWENPKQIPIPNLSKIPQTFGTFFQCHHPTPPNKIIPPLSILCHNPKLITPNHKLLPNKISADLISQIVIFHKIKKDKINKID
jgi:hypothetical protein